jgi:hypothetical protein
MVYLGYVIGGGELKIDLVKMEAIFKWPIPANVTEFRIFDLETQYLRKFITSFSAVDMPLHTTTTSGKSFQCRKNKWKAFNELKHTTSQTPILTFPNLHKPFEVERDTSGYDVGVVSMEGGKPICYHYEMFHGGVLNYPSYNKELYNMDQVVRKWKHYLMDKETIIHIVHQPLQYL